MDNVVTYNENIDSRMVLDKKGSDRVLTGFASIDKPWMKYYECSDKDTSLPNKTIYRYALDNNLNHFNETALEYFGFKVSYKEFFDQVDKAANSFVAMGVKKGDKVTICSPTFPETIYANYALNKIGAVANNIDPRNNASRIKANLNMVESDYLIMLDVAYPKIDSIIRDTKVKKVIYNSFSSSVPFLAKPIFDLKLKKSLIKKNITIPKIKDDLYMSWDSFIKQGKNIVAQEVSYEKDLPVAMVLTGGTTGFPKSVSLTNDSVLSVVESYKETDLSLERGQSLLNIMPEFIAYGWTFGVVMAPSLGIKDIIIPQFDINTFADDIIKYKPNHIVGVPTHLTALAKDKKMKDVDLSSFLVSVSAGGDSFFIEDEKKFNDFLHLHGFKNNVIVGFGLTEANSSVATRLNKCNIAGSVGVPLIKNVISIFAFPKDDSVSGTDVELSYGEEGEICVCSPSQMLGYYNEPLKTAEVQLLHKDGKVWTHTKDKGYITSDGVIYTKGRAKRMIIRPDGHNVWPIEMENILMKNKYVDNCIVVGIPSVDTTQGEYPRAVIVLKEDCPLSYEEIERELRKLCYDNLPERDVPYSYSFVKKIPLTSVDKADFNAVRDEELKKDAVVRTRKIK